MNSPGWLAFKDLLARYKTVWVAAWKERDQYIEKERLPYEAQFLPAALEIQQTPPSPMPRRIVWTLITFFLIAILWACFGKIDIVAVATGKVVPNDRVKTIQPIETSAVKQIYVRDGQAVKKGDVLIELDATASTADQTRVTDELTAARLEVARSQALINAINTQSRLQWNPPADIPLEVAKSAERLLQGQYDEYRSRVSTIDAEIAKRKAESESTKQIVEKLEQTVPIARQRADDFKGLMEKGFISKHGYLEKEQARIEQERDLGYQKSRLNEIQAAIHESTQQRASIVAEIKRAALNTLSEAERKSAGLSQEFIKVDQRTRLTKLIAPVDGTVQQLAAHTVGGVVTPAQPLMIIVPKDSPFEVEAWVENKDIGFVHADQLAEVKVETFTFTRYGTITGKVSSVSNDAVNDEKRGLIYQARVLMDKATIKVEDKIVNLSPGMAVTVEIKTGKRRIIDYFLSPLLQHGQESLKER